jgi:Txe/YoeB family toxin of Txe-Axe toxin-antitoxin module
MDIRAHITDGLQKIERFNTGKTEAYKRRIKEQIRVNIHEKKQPVQANQVLIDKYYSAKPQPLTQIQEALQGAL